MKYTHPNNSSKNPLANLIKQNPESFSNDYGSVKDFYLSSEIESPDEYTQMLHEIRTSRPTDIVNLHINCPGGNLFTTIQIMQAIADCSARVIASVEGLCASAATMIFLVADECQITNHSMFLFHNYRGCNIGKGAEMYSSIMHERAWSEKLLRDIYEHFLTPDEITDILNDKDIWMNAEEVHARLEARGLAYQAIHGKEKEEAPEEEAIEEVPIKKPRKPKS